MKDNCPDCGAKPGEKHKPGCDVERCPACGYQATQCLSDLGKLMCSNTNTEVGEDELIPWSGEWPGKDECREYGFWCRWDSRSRGMVGTWVDCNKDHPDAREDLNRLNTDCEWDRKQRKFVLKEKP